MNTIKQGVSVILPTYNEADNITPLINRISKSLQGRDFEILVVDDNSPDKTWQLAEGKPNVKVIRRMRDRGLVNSINEGIRSSSKEVVVWMDADLSMPPETIPRMIDALEYNDVVVASRYVKGGKDLRTPLRIITSKMTNLAANLVLNFDVLDYTSGFVAARKKVFTKRLLPQSVYGEYCIEFLYRAGKSGYRVKEIPYAFIDRIEGKSKTAGSFFSLLRFGFVYLNRILSCRIRK